MVTIYLTDSQMERLKRFEPLLKRLIDGRSITSAEYKQILEGEGGKVYNEVHALYNKHPHNGQHIGCSSCGAKRAIADAIRLAKWYFNTKNRI